MFVIYLFVPSVPDERGDECEIFVSQDDWGDAIFYRSECVWIVPGTVDPSED